MSGAKGALTGHSIVVGHLPDLSEQEAKAFYQQALTELPATRVRGFYGVCDGSEESASDVILLMYNEDHLKPILKFVCDRRDLLAIHKALGDLIRQRFA